MGYFEESLELLEFDIFLLGNELMVMVSSWRYCVSNILIHAAITIDNTPSKSYVKVQK